MGRITVDGTEFDIDHIGRGSHNPTYILKISLRNLNEVDLPHHELESILRPGSRSQITDELIRDEVEKFISKYPEAEIKGFGVVEEFSVREADPVTSDL